MNTEKIISEIKEAIEYLEETPVYTSKPRKILENLLKELQNRPSENSLGKISDGWFVYHAEFEHEEPYIIIANNDIVGEKSQKKLLVPKELAYFLTVHWCGTDKLKEIHRREVQNEIKNALGLNP